MTPPADRMRQHRERRKLGARVARVELLPIVIAAMVEYGWIGSGEITDRARIEDGLADLLQCWAEGRLAMKHMRYSVTGIRDLPPST